MQPHKEDTDLMTAIADPQILGKVPWIAGRLKSGNRERWP